MRPPVARTPSRPGHLGRVDGGSSFVLAKTTSTTSVSDARCNGVAGLTASLRLRREVFLLSPRPFPPALKKTPGRANGGRESALDAEFSLVQIHSTKLGVAQVGNGALMAVHTESAYGT
jgi:hypothetical protein